MSNNTLSIRIALVGLTGTGKTTSLTVLRLAMKQLGWQIHWLNPETKKYIMNEFVKMETDGLYPLPTELKEKHQYRFGVQRAPSNSIIAKIVNNERIRFEVNIFDVAGQRYGLEKTESTNDDIFLEDVATADGILFLIDPLEKWRGQEKASMGSILTNALGDIALSRYRSNAKDLYVAFCVTKMDMYPNAWFDAEVFAREFIFENRNVILAELKNFCNARNKVFCRWFSCSSVGFMNDNVHGALTLTRHYEDHEGGKIQDPENIKPMGIGEAFEWLLIEIGKKKLDWKTQIGNF